MFDTNAIAIATIGNSRVRVKLLARQATPGFWSCVSTNDPNKQYMIHETRLEEAATVPYRMREHKFVRYAAIIGSALRAYPAPIQVNPTAVNADTFVAQYREAITAKQKYGYKHPLVDEQLFNEHGNDIRHAAILPNGHVLVGPRDAIRAPAKNIPTGELIAFAETAQPMVEFKGPVAKLDALCEAVASRFYEPPITFFVRSLPPEIAESLQARYDVAIVPDKADPTKSIIL